MIRHPFISKLFGLQQVDGRAFGSTSKTKICMGKLALPASNFIFCCLLQVLGGHIELGCRKMYRAKAGKCIQSGRLKKGISGPLQEHFAGFYLTTQMHER